ncbi:MAG: nucleotidyltransferase domain-containing protein [Bacteroidales bacterium]|nr:nucleotidyltransferase domain-containing protein [Bacteroidales bacterium]
MIHEYIREFEKKTGATVVYVTKSGSKLYGTDTPDSDTDYKGIFIPSEISVLMKTDLDSYSKDSNSMNIKNSADDIDFTLHSIYSFFNHLAKSETGAVDVLFSMFREDTIIYQDLKFIAFMKTNYTQFLNSHMKSFIGYALGQTKKFGIKGARYENLVTFTAYIKSLSEPKDTKLKKLFGKFENETHAYKYIKMVIADGPKTSQIRMTIPYLSVLGKLFHGQITLEYFITRLEEQVNQFGNRTKTIAATTSKTDFKALSHSYRIASEVEELLQTQFIKFPLKDATKIREIKQGNCDIETVIQEISSILANVDVLLETTIIPKSLDVLKLRQQILQFL